MNRTGSSVCMHQLFRIVNYDRHDALTCNNRRINNECKPNLPRSHQDGLVFVESEELIRGMNKSIQIYKIK